MCQHSQYIKIRLIRNKTNLTCHEIKFQNLRGKSDIVSILNFNVQQAGLTYIRLVTLCGHRGNRNL